MASVVCIRITHRGPETSRRCRQSRERDRLYDVTDATQLSLKRFILDGRFHCQPGKIFFFRDFRSNLLYRTLAFSKLHVVTATG